MSERTRTFARKASVLGATVALVVGASLGAVSAKEAKSIDNPLPPRAGAAPPPPAAAVPLNPIYAHDARVRGVAANAVASDPSLRNLASRLRVMRSTLRAQALATTGTANSTSFAQHKRVAELRKSLGSAVNVRLRKGSRTPMWIEGRGLERGGGVSSNRKERHAQTAARFLRNNSALLRLDDPDNELKLERVDADRLGRARARFSQRHRGVPVWPASLNVHLDAQGAVDLANGAFVETPRDLDTTPSVTEAAAADYARVAVNARVAEVVNQTLIVFAPGDRSPRLAWRMTVQGPGIASVARWDVIIDAKNGDTLARYNLVKNDNVVGSGVDLFSTTRALNVWRDDTGTHFLTDTSKPMFDAGASTPPSPSTTVGGISVLDLRNAPATSESPLFFITSPSPVGWTLADGVSAAANIAETYDYYLERHARNSLDGAGGTIVGIVRVESGLVNAFWNGRAMFFGDGAPFAGAMDVVAHELTHGVVENEANLIYQDQPGALNESFADIFGEAAEARLFGVPDWILGQRMGFPIRNMINPGAFSQPSKMSEFVFTDQDNGGVHINSGIPNHAFYLAAEGLSGAIGAVDAERIFYRALSVHLVQNSQFIDMRLAVVQSAEELFGVGSLQAQKVAEAFDAVELFDGAQTPDPDPFPGTPGDDATLFVYAQNGVHLGRREDAFGDPEQGVLLSADVNEFARSSVSGDGSFAAFVDGSNDVCLISTDSPSTEECSGVGGVASVAVSPDGNTFAFVFLDSSSISIINFLDETDDRTFELEAPANDGEGNAPTVVSADALDFTADGRYLLYDAYNIVDVSDGSSFGGWSIYAYDLDNDNILNIVSPIEGLDFGFPALGQTRDDLITFDATDNVAGVNTVLAGNLTSGEIKEIVTTGVFGIPGFTGDDTAIVYSEVDALQATEANLLRQPLGSDQITPQGSASLWLGDAKLGVIYRRGTFTGPGVDLPTAASVLPASRSVQVGNSATAFATMINAGDATARNCSIVPMTGLSSGFFFQPTDPATNAAVGSPNLPVDIPAGGSQSFLIAFAPNAAFSPTDVELSFACENSLAAQVIRGVNTILLSSSTSAVPDIIALAATAGNDGIVKVPGVNSTGVFSVASVNIGSTSNITVSADTGGVGVPVNLFVCETNPSTGDCISPLGASVSTTVGAGETPTFGVFVQANAASPFDPALRRAYVRFKDASGITRGSTSVAIQVL